MISPGVNLIRGSGTMSSEMPPLPQCLPLEPITVGHHKYAHSGDLRRALGVPLDIMSDDNSFAVSHPKPPPPVATEELRHYKDSVKDASRKAGDRAKRFHKSLLKLDKYREALSSKKRQRSDLALNERSNGANVGRIGSLIHRSPHDILTQRLEDRAKSVGLNKRVRTSVADVRAEGRPAIASRQQVLMAKGGDIPQDIDGDTIRFEEKIRRLPAGGEGWETKNKKKRSIGLVGSSSIHGDQDIKRAMHPKMNAESKSRLSCDSQGFRSKSSPGLRAINKLDGCSEPSSSDTSTILLNEMENGSLLRDRMALVEPRIVAKGSNKTNVHEDTQTSSPNTVVKAKICQAPRTGSILLLETSLKAHPSSTSVQGLEQPANLNKVPVPGVAENQKHQMSAGSPHAITQWVGQRPHKNARTRRANVVAPVSGHNKGQSSSQCFSASDLGAQTSVGTNRSVIASTLENNAPKVKREVESVPSTFGLSESEESGAGENKTKDKITDSGEVTLTASQKPGAFLLSGRKNKLNTNEIGDGVRRQGRIGRDSSLSRTGVPPAREKLENLPTTKPLPSVKPASDRNKSKTGRPPSKKLKDQRALARVGPMVNGSSLDLTGESDDHEELFMAANSARNASNFACSGPFWKKVEPIFASIGLEDMSYLKQQLSVAEELDECLSQMVGVECSVLAVLEHKGLPGSGGERLKDNPNQESIKIASLPHRVDMGKLDKCAPLYQRVLSALIGEDETEEFYLHSEGKNISLHYASDDSHCGSCNLIDFEPKYRDRIESEVESKENYQTQKNSSWDRISGDNKSVACNNIRNPSMSSSLHSTEQWLVDDDSSHSDIVHASEICSNDLIQPQMRDSAVPAFSSDNQYQLMSLEDRLLLELQSIGLCPETLPDLAEGEELINQDIMELKEGLYQQMGQKRRKLMELDKALQKGIQEERRNPEKVAMDQLVEMAYRKRLACRGNSNTKGTVRKVSKQVALAFVKRTLDRCRKFEDMGSSCFSDPALQDAIFCSHLCNNDAKSADCVGSGTASNTCNEVTNHCTEARGSGAISSTLERHDSFSDNISRGKRREVLIDDVIGSASSRVTSTLDSTVLSGVKGKRSDRERDQNKDNLRSNGIMGGGRSLLEGIRSERKTKPKPKQKSNHVSSSGNGLHRSSNGVANASNNVDRGARSASLNNIPNDASKSEDFSNLRLPELDTIGLGEPQDIASWLNFDEDGLHDHDSIGLDIPMDDLSELNMLM